MAAALAYYALFSSAPLLLLAVLIASWFFGEQAAQERVTEHLTEFLGAQGARELTRMMAESTQIAPRWDIAGIGAAVWLFGALGTFLHLRQCLSTIWRLQPASGNGIFSVLFNYLLAVLTVLGLCLLLLVSVGLSTALRLIDGFAAPAWLGWGTIFWERVHEGVSFVVLLLCFALIFRVLSGREIAWVHVLYGAVVTSLLFLVGKVGISLYLAHTSTASVYGAAGSVVALLIWIYYSAQIFFLGAELVQARRTRAEWNQ
jgi:membrane protein